MKRSQLQGTRMLGGRGGDPYKRRQELVEQSLQFGLDSAWSITDRTIPLFDRNPMLNGKYSSATTFLGVPFQEDMRALESPDVVFVGHRSMPARPTVRALALALRRFARFLRSIPATTSSSGSI